MTKILALYLPQFHETPENNKWWGKGFTEWTNTKKAKPFFRNHYQPRTPLNNNFYDLTKPDVMPAQVKLAKTYGVNGFCFYHYWFDGKQMLHKPVQDFLNRKEIDFDFCLSWANDSWNKAWDGEEREILIKQEYGEELNWQKHLEYLMPFFKDQRYIKVKNRPVFFVYRSVGFDRMNEMMEFWNKILKENGFNGIHLVETLNSFQNKPSCSISKAVFLFEPMMTLRNNISLKNRIIGIISSRLTRNILNTDNYDRVWTEIIRNANALKFPEKKIYKGAFSDWDNSPRKGRKGLIIKGASPQKFGKYLSKLYALAKQDNDEFLIINAWNEWAEGCYLEPDEKFKYDYLEQIKNLSTV